MEHAYDLRPRHLSTKTYHSGVHYHWTFVSNSKRIGSINRHQEWLAMCAKVTMTSKKNN